MAFNVESISSATMPAPHQAIIAHFALRVGLRCETYPVAVLLFFLGAAVSALTVTDLGVVADVAPPHVSH